MRPQGDYILNTVATNLAAKYLPKVKSDTEKAELALMSFLMGAVSEEFDRAAHRRIEENQALRALFSQSLSTVKDDGLKARLKVAIKKKEGTDCRVSSLDQANCEFVELLIELHAHIETIDDEKSRDVEKSIWQELKNYAKRREFRMWEISQTILLEARKASG
jgi:hypothetical protein